MLASFGVVAALCLGAYGLKCFNQHDLPPQAENGPFRTLDRYEHASPYALGSADTFLLARKFHREELDLQERSAKENLPQALQKANAASPDLGERRLAAVREILALARQIKNPLVRACALKGTIAKLFTYNDAKLDEQVRLLRQGKPYKGEWHQTPLNSIKTGLVLCKEQEDLFATFWLATSPDPQKEKANIGGLSLSQDAGYHAAAVLFIPKLGEKFVVNFEPTKHNSFDEQMTLMTEKAFLGQKGNVPICYLGKDGSFVVYAKSDAPAEAGPSAKNGQIATDPGDTKILDQIGTLATTFALKGSFATNNDKKSVKPPGGRKTRAASPS